jgi:putative membrane protein
MGSADIVPGVSGGTMAFILGVYEDLLNAIKSVNLETIRLGLQFKIKAVMDKVPWRFLLALVLGIFTAILTLAQFISTILDNYLTDPEPREFLFAFFFGLVLASIIAIGARIEQWRPAVIGGLVVGTVVALIIALQTPSRIEANVVNLFFSGMVAIMAMILPGISGSFILLILGQYDNVLNAVTDLEIVNILAIGFGAVIGLALFARILSWLLNNYHQTVVALLVGFMIGSLYKIWPWKEVEETDFDRHGHEFATKEANLTPEINTELLIALGLMVVGFVIVTALDHWYSKDNAVVLALRKLRG